MAELLPIAQLGDSILRQEAQSLSAQHLADSGLFIENLLHTLAHSNGVGLAAPQVFESIRMVVVASRPTARYPNAPDMPATLMINPSFEPLSDAKHKDWEGCLSIPGIRALVPRFEHIGIRYLDAQGKTQHQELDGFVARVFQHEYDHLDGFVYLDRIETTRDIISESEFFKLLAA